MYCSVYADAYADAFWELQIYTEAEGFVELGSEWNGLINTGEGQRNTITAFAGGYEVGCGINGVQVATLTIPSTYRLGTGDVGVIVGFYEGSSRSGAVTHVEDFTVKAPN